MPHKFIKAQQTFIHTRQTTGRTGKTLEPDLNKTENRTKMTKTKKLAAVKENRVKMIAVNYKITFDSSQSNYISKHRQDFHSNPIGLM